MPPADAVIFDLDGVLLDSEQLWDEARRTIANEHGGRWTAQATRDMQGMSAPEWSRYLVESLGVQLNPQRVAKLVVERLQDAYRRHLPLLPGALQTVRCLAREWPLGLASSANAEVIELSLDLSGLRSQFSAWLSSEEVGAGKPAPDVYLEAARRLGAAPRRCVAVEDSSNGLRSAAAAGMAVVAVPNRAYPPTPDALALAAVAVEGVGELTPELVRLAASRHQAGRGGQQAAGEG